MKTNILLAVDDKPDNLYVLKSLIAQHLPGCKVLTALSAEEGLATMAESDLDGVLIDVQMPGMSGIEMCRQLKSDERTAHMPVILITAHSAEAKLRAEGLEAGADDFLTKPIDNIELVAKIKVMLRIKQAQNELRDMNARLEQLVDERTQTLRESEGKYRALFEKEKNAIFVHDPETMLILDANPAMSSTYGYSYEGLIGMNCLELSAEVEESLKAAASADEDGRFKVDLRWHKKKDGTVFPLELDGYSAVLNGKTVGFTVINDITDRRKAEEMLRESETKFRTLFEASSDAVMLLNERIFFGCNPATLAMFNCATQKEFCDKHPADLSPPTQPDGTDSRTLADEHIATAMEAGSHRFEWMHRRMSGEDFYADVTLSAIKLGDRGVLQALVRDITERKRDEEELAEHREHLEERVRDRTEELRKVVNLMAGRENRMVELKRAIKNLRLQIEEAGMTPVADERSEK